MSIEFAIVQDALEVSIVLLISFEHLEVTRLIFHNQWRLRKLAAPGSILRSNLLFSLHTGLVSLLSDLRNCWIGKANARSETPHSPRGGRHDLGGEGGPQSEGCDEYVPQN